MFEDEQKQITEQDLDEAEAELKRMKPESPDTIQKCKRLMEMTRARRQTKIRDSTGQNMTLTDIFNAWPAFRSLPGSLVLLCNLLYIVEYKKWFSAICDTATQYSKNIELCLQVSKKQNIYLY